MIFVMSDMPPLELQTNMILASGAYENNKLYGSIGQCDFVKQGDKRELYVEHSAYNIFYLKDDGAPGWDDAEQIARVQKNSVEKGTPNYYEIDPYDHTEEVTVLNQPEFGSLIRTEGEFQYTPNDNYIGTDSLSLLVKMAGYEIKVVYYFNVMESIDDKEYVKSLNLNNLTDEDYSKYLKYCPNGGQWLLPNHKLDQSYNLHKVY